MASIVTPPGMGCLSLVNANQRAEAAQASLKKRERMLMPTVIAVAPNGGRRSKSDHPALPMTTDEIARDAVSCRDAGAAMIHLHVRDRDGRHSLDPELYREAIGAVRRMAGQELVVQITTEAIGRYGPEAQMEVVRAVRPEAASLALRELAPGESDKGRFADFMNWMVLERIAPQLILYDAGDAERAVRWAREGVFAAGQVSLLYVLGRYAPPTAGEPRDLLDLRVADEAMFQDWMACAFGRQETACVVLAALLGGNIRVGFENNLVRADGTLASDNADRVRAVAQTLQAVGLRPASPSELRAAWFKAG